MNSITRNELKYNYECHNIVCNWCKGNHISRQCNVEKLVKKELKDRVGSAMEQFVEKCIQCPQCLSVAKDYSNRETFCSFERLANNTPSLDLECKVCGFQVEVKSKCLSVNNLPDQIYCKAGNYKNLIENIYKNNINIIVIIYSADRDTKDITIKEVLLFDNYELRKGINIVINKQANSTLSDITIFNKNTIPRLCFNIKKMSFESFINKIEEELNNNELKMKNYNNVNTRKFYY